VRKLSRVLLVVLAAVIALGGIALIAANLYVQSQATQARIQQEVSHRIGVTLRIGRVSVTPWGGLKLSAIAIPQSNPPGAGNFLQARTFRLRLRLLSLLARQLVIKEVSVVDPTVTWPQNEQGKWKLPGSEREQMASSPGVAPPSPDESAPASLPDSNTVAPAAPESTVVGKQSSPKTRDAFETDVRHVNVARGRFHFLDRARATVATFDGVNFRSTLGTSHALRGHVAVDKVSLRERFYLSDLQSPIRYAAPELELGKISAHLAGGEIAGQFKMQPESADSPFTVSLKFREVEADQIVTEAHGPSGIIRGKLEGTFDGQGNTADANALSGTGEIFLRDGQLQQYSLLVALGQILQIEELTQLHLDQAQAKYHVAPGVVTVDELVLRSPNIRLTATGTVGFNGKLRLTSQLAINEKVRGQLFKPIRQNFQPTNEPGLSAVDFEITGTLERPKTNLVERVVGKDLKDLGSVIDSFLGKSKSDRPKKKKNREAEPAESASPTPNETATPSPTP
jgi:uncharacterized protein involved in outer membrane biogenesis